MDQEFWDSYSQIKFEYFYYDFYIKRDERFRMVVDMIAGGVSLICVGGWAFSGKLAAIWSVIILASQFLALYIDKTKLMQRIHVLKFYLMDTDELLIDMAYKWREMYCGLITEDATINKLIRDSEKAHSRLVNKYIVSLTIPEKAKLIKSADERTNSYLRLKHGSGVDDNEQDYKQPVEQQKY